MDSYIYLYELIAYLETLDLSSIVPFGFGKPHSYRGYYQDVAFEPKTDVTIGEMLDHANSALGATFTGYKGGEYTMTASTDCWIAEYDSAGGDKIGPTMLQLWGAIAGKKEAAHG